MNVRTLRGFVHAQTAWEGANVSCIATDEGLVLVDTPLLPEDIEAWRAFVVGLAPDGPRFVVNTDHHFDHVLGNRRLGGTVISHRAARDEVLRDGGTLREAMIDAFPSRTPEQKRFIVAEPLVAAHVTLERGLSLHLGGREIRLIHTPGHTPATLCVHLPEDGILLTGDGLTAELHPYKGQACFADWLASLALLDGLDADLIVPGHGEVCTKRELSRMVKYLEELIGITRGCLSDGLPKDHAVREARSRLLGYFPVEPGLEQTVEQMFDEGTARLYDELGGVAR